MARRRRPIIPWEWLYMAPTQRPVSFWLRVKARVKKRGIRMKDWDKVREVILTEPYPIKTSIYEEERSD